MSSRCVRSPFLKRFTNERIFTSVSNQIHIAFLVVIIIAFQY